MIRILLLTGALLAATDAFGARWYHVGNSLTFDALAGWGMYDVFDDGGVPIERPEYHIRCNSSLHNTLLHSNDACALSDDGPWPQALPANTYDALILQPHQGGTTAQEINAIAYYQGLTNAPLIIYEAFPPQSEFDHIADYYELPAQADFRQTRAEFQKIREAYPGAIIVPAMQVLIEIDERAIWGLIPDVYSVKELYRDGAHMNALGRYVLALTFFAALTGQDPAVTGLDLHPLYAAVTDVQALEIQAAVNEVVLDGPANVVPVPLPLPWLVLLAVMLGLAPAMLRRKLAPNSR